MRLRKETLIGVVCFCATVTLFCAAGPGCAARFRGPAYTVGEVRARKGTDVVLRVSLINLIANPEKYEGKTVYADGILSLGNERSALFYASEQVRQNRMADAVWLELPPDWFLRLQRFDGRLCRVVGRFDMSIKGHFGMFCGSLIDIELIDIE